MATWITPGSARVKANAGKNIRVDGGDEVPGIAETGDLVNENDPDGTCAVILAGITQGASSGEGMSDEAAALSADSAYPYDGLGLASSVASVIAQGFAPNNATAAALSAIRYALSSNQGSIDIIAYSGGAGAFTAAFKELSASDQKRIANVLYISPGAAGQIPSGSGATTIIEGTSFGADALAMVGTQFPYNTSADSTPCQHDDDSCLLNSAAAEPALRLIKRDGPCNNPVRFSPKYTKGLPGFFPQSGGGKLHAKTVDNNGDQQILIPNPLIPLSPYLP